MALNFLQQKKRHFTVELDNVIVYVTRKKMKNIRLRICHETGKVSLSCPVVVSESAVAEYINQQAQWIHQHHQAIVERIASRQNENTNQFTLFGQTYRLTCHEYQSDEGYKLSENSVALYFKADASPCGIQAKKERILREQLQSRIPELAYKWQPTVGKYANEIRLKKMKTKWGSCNILEKRIWLNVYLAEKPLECVEYVLVHELVHLHERYHNQRFKHLMTQFMPNWHELEQRLNRPEK